MPGAYLYGWVGDPVNAWVKCKVTAQGKLIIDPTAFLENPPTEDEAKKAPTSEWAFDHNADTVIHHIKYTDVNARDAINNIFGADGKADAGINMDKHFLTGVKDIYYYDTLGGSNYIKTQMQQSDNRVLFRYYKVGIGYSDVDFYLTDGVDYKKLISENDFQGELADYLENPPVENSVNTAPTSAWAFDHNADTDKHHTKYTNKEAVDAFYARILNVTNGVYVSLDVTEVSMIFMDATDGAIQFLGLTNGYIGQIIIFVTINATDSRIFRHNSGAAAVGDKIRTKEASDSTIAANSFGGCTMVYDGTYWVATHPIN